MVKCRCGTDLGPAERACPICGTPREDLAPENTTYLPPKPVVSVSRRAAAFGRIETYMPEQKRLEAEERIDQLYRDIREQIGDEEKADLKYTSMADIALQLGLGDADVALTGIAAQERGHAQILERLLAEPSSAPIHSSLESDLKSELCPLLKEAAEALYYIYDVKPEGIAHGKYEELSLKVLDAMKAMGCPNPREDNTDKESARRRIKEIEAEQEQLSKSMEGLNPFEEAFELMSHRHIILELEKEELEKILER